MAWPPQNLKEALLPILIVNWIFCLGVLEFPLGKRRFFISFIYAIILISGYFYLPITLGFDFCNFDPVPTLGTHLLNAIWYYDILTALSSIITFFYYQKELMSCIKRIELIDQTLDCLGTKNSWITIFKTGLLQISLTLLAMCIPFIADFFWYLIAWTFTRSLYCTYRFHAPIILVTIADITFEIIVRSIFFSMKNINRLLEKTLRSDTLLKSYYNITNNQKYRIMSLMMTSEFNSESTEKTKNLIQLIKQIHLELSKITWDVNKILGMQMAMTTVAYIILIVLHTYYLANAVLMWVILSTTSWCLIRLTRIAVINNICDRLTEEALRSKEIIYELKKISENVDLDEEIEQFSLQISQRPLHFSMCGLFTLNRGLIGSVLTTIVTYLVCLVQVAPREPLLERNKTQ